MRDSGSRFIRKSALFLTILFSFVPAFVKTQTLDQTYSFALSQARVGNYDIAVKSLKRVQFFDEQNHFPNVFRDIADCYFEKKEFENAFYYYDLASIQAEGDSIVPDLVARKVTCKLQENQFQEALVSLFSFEGKLNPFQQWQFNMLYGITYFYLGDYQQSKQYFLRNTDSNMVQTLYDVNTGFSHIQHIERRYNPKTAKILSMILPGAGQMWVGDYRNGLNSLALIASLFSASVALTGSVTVLDSIIIVAPWFQRYYMGGYERAYGIAANKQQDEKNKLLAQIVNMLNQPPANN